MSETEIRAIFGDKARIRLDISDGAYLRPVRESDVTAIYVDGLNDPEVNRFMTAVRENRQTHASVVAYVRENWQNPRDCLFGIFVDDELRGSVRLHDVSQRNGSAILGVVLFDRRVWGKGWGTRAIARVADYALEELQLWELIAGVYTGNVSSQTAFERAEFALRDAASSPDGDPYAILTYRRTRR